MILSDKSIRSNNIVTPCEERATQRGMSYGLSCCGYDVRASADIGAYDTIQAQPGGRTLINVGDGVFTDGLVVDPGKSILIGCREHFDIPLGVVGLVRDKSTWARQGLLVNQGVLEPGWKGHLSIRVFNVGEMSLTIANGDPIAQIIFQWLDTVPDNPYAGKYQHSPSGPRGPIYE